jgi:hypothetical protein
MVGDPVRDFAGLIMIGGRSFVSEVLGHYRLGVEEDFWARFEWLTRVSSLTWLADASVDSPDELDKHLSWVRDAFAA